MTPGDDIDAGTDPLAIGRCDHCQCRFYSRNLNLIRSRALCGNCLPVVFPEYRPKILTENSDGTLAPAG